MTPEQQQAIDALHSWGWAKVEPYGDHFVIHLDVEGDSFHRWCAVGLVEYAQGYEKHPRAYHDCPKHQRRDDD